jgi:hypothetical protein
MKAMKVNPKLDLGWILGPGRTIPARFALGPGYHDRNSRALPQGLCRSILFFLAAAGEDLRISSTSVSKKHGGGAWFPSNYGMPFFFC